MHIPKGTNIHMLVYPTPVVPKQYVLTPWYLHVYTHVYENITHTGSTKHNISDMVIHTHTYLGKK